MNQKNKKAKMFISKEKPENYNLDCFKELEYTEISEITNLPPAYPTPPKCSDCLIFTDFITGEYPKYYYRCPECMKSFRLEHRKEKNNNGN